MIIHNFFFGVGLDDFRSLSPEGMYSHSNYIEIASTTGIVGFFIFFSIFVIVWRRLRRIEKTYKEPQCLYNIGLFKAAILTILLQSFATVNYSSKLTWIFLATVTGYSWSLERSLLGLISAHKKYVRRLKQDAPRDR
jgi:O-antigen ligase